MEVKEEDVSDNTLIETDVGSPPNFSTIEGEESTNTTRAKSEVRETSDSIAVENAVVDATMENSSVALPANTIAIVNGQQVELVPLTPNPMLPDLDQPDPTVPKVEPVSLSEDESMPRPRPERSRSRDTGSPSRRGRNQNLQDDEVASPADDGERQALPTSTVATNTAMRPMEVIINGEELFVE